MTSQLSDLQTRVLALLKDLKPRWILTGGAALAGFHTHHRKTDHLDLFFHGQSALTHEPREVASRLQSAGLTSRSVQSGRSFHRLSVVNDGELLNIDLVAEPVANLHPPEERDGILLDTKQEILINKLCALLSRQEVRDLEDVRVLLQQDTDLYRAIEDAPKKDGGFSPPTLAWILSSFPLERSETLGFNRDALRQQRDALIEILDDLNP